MATRRLCLKLSKLSFSRIRPNLPEHKRAIIAVATVVISLREVAEKTFSAELAMSFNCVWLTLDPIPREYTCIFLRLSGREASESSLNGP